MKDRTPTYPGRVRLTPVAGKVMVFDLQMADQPVEEGTPLNKAALLTDAVASAIGALGGVSAPETPSQALELLAQTLAQVKPYPFRIQTGSYVGTGTYGENNPCSLTFDFAPALIWCGQCQYTMGNYYYSGTPYLGLLPAFLLTEEYSRGPGNYGLGFGTGNNLYGKKSADGKTVSWYSSSGGTSYQNNTSGATYYYIAIG